MERPRRDTGLPGSPNGSWGITHHGGRVVRRVTCHWACRAPRQCPGPCLGPRPRRAEPRTLDMETVQRLAPDTGRGSRRRTVCSQEQGSEPQKCRFKSMPSLSDLEQVI